MSRSASALRTHFAVVFFIEGLAFRQDFQRERIAIAKTFLNSLGSPHQEIKRKWRRHGNANLGGLIELIARRHHHDEINVAISVRLAVCVGTEQDDLVRMKAFSDSARKPLDRAV